VSAVLAAWRARAAASSNAVSRAWRRSALRLSCLTMTSAVVGAGLFFGAWRAFAYLSALDVIGPVLVARLLSLFFFILFTMLVLSNAIVAFQTFYRSREAAFWMLAPLRADQVWAVRSAEVGVIASWAFLVLGLPLLFAHGLGSGARGAFYALLPVVLVLFAASAHAIGTLLIVALVRLFPGLDLTRVVVLAVAALVPVGFAVVRAFRIGGIPDDADGTELVVSALEGLGRTQYPLLPGYWAATALSAAARGDLPRAGFFSWMLVATAGFLLLLSREAAWRWLVPGYQLLRGAAVERPVVRRTRRRGGAPARGPLRALAQKDALLFLREPAQWSQVGLVATLLLVYVLNLRNLPDLSRFALWGSLASYLNLGVVLLLVATLTTRFAFPLISMEGRRAWIALLAPLPRTALVTQKLLLAWPLALAFGLLAAVGSTHVLGVASSVRNVTLLAVSAAAFALSALAVGLGALFPDLREDNPARIVSGFGGTLSFLLSVAYVAALTALLGAPSLLQATGRIGPVERGELERWGLVVGLLLSLASGLAPLLLGRRHLARLEP
jgi:ABC-2 type transport system permease protein